MEPGFQLSWSAQNPFYSLFIVQEGSVEVRIDGMEKFTAKERDVLHIPTHLSGEITAPDAPYFLTITVKASVFVPSRNCIPCMQPTRKRQNLKLRIFFPNINVMYADVS